MNIATGFQMAARSSMWLLSVLKKIVTRLYKSAQKAQTSKIVPNQQYNKMYEMHAKYIQYVVKIIKKIC